MDKQVIQSVGFRNIEENGEVTGFQLKIRLPYYRGVYLSQIRPGHLIVDGEIELEMLRGHRRLGLVAAGQAEKGCAENHGNLFHNTSIWRLKGLLRIERIRVGRIQAGAEYALETDVQFLADRRGVLLFCLCNHCLLI